MAIVQYEGRGGEIMETESTLEVVGPNAAYSLVKATIDSQIATARAFPRNVHKSMALVKALAGSTQSIAAGCIYSMPRDGQKIEGPSTRFAEILQSCWGNISVQGRVMEEGDKYIVVMGECIDLERNSRRQVELRGSIIKRNGMRYSPDMVVTTANALISKATRNAIFQIIPRAFWEEAFQDVRGVVKGAMPVDVARKSWLDYWEGEQGVSNERVYEALGVSCREDITDDHIVTMTGWNTAIEEGQSINDIFPAPVKASAKAQALTSTLADVKSKQAAANQVKQPVKTEPAKEELPDEPGMRG